MKNEIYEYDFITKLETDLFVDKHFGVRDNIYIPRPVLERVLIVSIEKGLYVFSMVTHDEQFLVKEIGSKVGKVVQYYFNKDKRLLLDVEHGGNIADRRLAAYFVLGRLYIDDIATVPETYKIPNNVVTHISSIMLAIK